MLSAMSSCCCGSSQHRHDRQRRGSAGADAVSGPARASHRHADAVLHQADRHQGPRSLGRGAGDRQPDIQEGAQSPADVYFTENSPELTLLDEKELLAKIDAATLAQAPQRQRGGRQLGRRAGPRERAGVQSVDDPGEPCRPRCSISPSRNGRARSRSRPAMRTSCRWSMRSWSLKGQDAALDWLKGLKQNAQVFDDDEGVVAAVDRGASRPGSSTTTTGHGCARSRARTRSQPDPPFRPMAMSAR